MPTDIALAVGLVIAATMTAAVAGLRSLVRLALGERRSWRLARGLADAQAEGLAEAMSALDKSQRRWDAARRGQQ